MRGEILGSPAANAKPVFADAVERALEKLAVDCVDDRGQHDRPPLFDRDPLSGIFVSGRFRFPGRWLRQLAKMVSLDRCALAPIGRQMTARKSRTHKRTRERAKINRRVPRRLPS